MESPPHLQLPQQRASNPGLDVISEQTRSLVFATILSGGPLSRTQVAHQTGLSPSTVTKVVAPLLDADYVVEGSLVRSGTGSGRPQRMLAVNHGRHVVLGLKLHPTHVHGVRTDIGLQVVARAIQRVRGHSPEQIHAAATAVVEELLADRPGPRPLGLGVGVGGHVHSATGMVVHSGILGWDSVDVGWPLARATGLPTVVNNDLNALAVAERWFGHGRDARSFAVVSVGAGVGCGLILDGHLYSGTSGLAGELGHLPLEPDGPPCSCGNNGCLEAVASDAAILRTIGDECGRVCRTIEQAMQFARTDTTAGGDVARKAFRLAGGALGRGLATLSNLLNLRRIILSGEGVAAYDLLGPALEEAWHAHGFSTATRDCELIVDGGDDDLWARGAACLVIHHALERVDPIARSA